MTRRVWVLPPTGPPEPEGGGRAALEKNGARPRDNGGTRRLRWHRAKTKKAPDTPPLEPGPGVSSAPPDLGTGISSAPDR
jgi:hypothetical protein